MVTMALWDHPAMLLQWGAVLGASLAAALHDLRTRRIPNMLTGILLFSGLLAAPLFAGFAGLADAALGMALLGLPFVVLFVVAGGGAGDAKLMAGLGAWLGVVNGAIVLVAVTAAGALVGVLYAITRRRLRPVFFNLGCMSLVALIWLRHRGHSAAAAAVMPGTQDMLAVPYGVSIFLGTVGAAGGVLLWRV